MDTRNVYVSRLSFNKEYQEWVAEGFLELWSSSVRWIARWIQGIGWELELPLDLVRDEEWERDAVLEIGEPYEEVVRRELRLEFKRRNCCLAG